MAHLLLKDKLGESWAEMLQDEIKKTYFRKIPNILKRERNLYEIYPESKDVFRAYRLSPYDKTKVVILGQDPYYKRGEANGLAFSVNDEIGYFPPSLENIFDEVERSLDILNLEWSGDLSPWAKQGVMLLNTILTVRKGEPGSHSKIGWDKFTKKTVDILNGSVQPIVFMLWGSHAKSYASLIDDSHHCILKTSHPSPLSSYRGFKGCDHFAKCNTFLEKHNLQPINWKTTI